MTKVLILAAGYATRLYPLTKDKAKPLLPVAEKPLIEYIIEKIYEVECVDEIIVVTNAKFYEDFKEWKSSFDSKIPIKILNDGSTSNENRLGAIKDIKFAVDEENIDEDLLVLAGDNLFEFSLKDLYDYYKEKNAPVTLAYDTGNIDIVKNRHGVVVLDKENKVIDFQEKPSAPKSTVKSIACYVLNKKAIDLLDDYISKGENTDAPGFFIEWLCKKTDFYAYIIEEPIFDIGNMESYKKANETYKKTK